MQGQGEDAEVAGKPFSALKMPTKSLFWWQELGERGFAGLDVAPGDCVVECAPELARKFGCDALLRNSILPLPVFRPARTESVACYRAAFGGKSSPDALDERAALSHKRSARKQCQIRVLRSCARVRISHPDGDARAWHQSRRLGDAASDGRAMDQ